MALGAVTLAARTLSPAEFGTVVFMHAVVLFLTETATFDSWLLVVREGSQALTTGSKTQFGRIVRFSIALDGLAALIAFSLAAAMVFVLPSEGGPLGTIPAALAIGYFSLVLLRQTSASLGVLRMFGRYDLLGAGSLLRPVLRLAGSLAVAGLGGGLIGFLATWFAASAATYLAYIFLGLRELKRRGLLGEVFSAPPSLRSPETGAWSFTWLTNLSSTLDASTRQLPLLLVGILAGPAAAGLFKIAQEVSSLLAKAVRTVDRVVFPAFAAFEASGEAKASRSLMLRTSLAFAAAGGLLVAGLVFAGSAVLSGLFGEPYGEAADAAALLVLAATMTAVASPVLSAKTAEGKLGLPVFLRLGGLLAMLAVFWPLTSIHGYEGSAWAVLVGSVVVVLGAGVAVLRRRVE
jgi:O-antigen/teichoic acid export membrane protein